MVKVKLTDIPDYKGFYKISEYGDVYSIPRNGTINSPKKMSQHKDKDGYFRVSLRKNGSRKQVSIARLVAKTFIQNPKGYPQVNHKDGIKTNNHLLNLEWCTVKMNVNHSWDLGLRENIRKGVKERYRIYGLKSRKLTMKQAEDIRKLFKLGKNKSELARQFDIDNHSILNIINKKSYMCGGPND